MWTKQVVGELALHCQILKLHFRNFEFYSCVRLMHLYLKGMNNRNKDSTIHFGPSDPSSMKGAAGTRSEWF